MRSIDTSIGTIKGDQVHGCDPADSHVDTIDMIKICIVKNVIVSKLAYDMGTQSL